MRFDQNNHGAQTANKEPVGRKGSDREEEAEYSVIKWRKHGD